MMTAIGAISLIYVKRLIKMADIIAASSIEGLMGTDMAYSKRIQEIRNQEGQKVSAKNLRSLLKDSKILKSHKKCSKVQDAYSLRCIPQVHGAVRDAYNYAAKIIENEMNSSTDNPLVFPETGEVISGGNFHGQTVAIPMDALKIAVSALASISERRLYKLMNENETGLYPFLSKDAGLNSGFMMLQVTAASLVSENKILSHPASVDSIPTSLGQEDHVSMGTIAARKLMEVIENTADVLSIELFAAMMALRFREPLISSLALNGLKKFFFKRIKAVDCDRPFYKDIEKINKMLLNGDFNKEISKYVEIK